MFLYTSQNLFFCITAVSPANRSGAKDAAERERKLAAWQAGLDQRELAAEDLRERSRELEEAERQVRAI